jgi:hypothetical protein
VVRVVVAAVAAVVELVVVAAAAAAAVAAAAVWRCRVGGGRVAGEGSTVACTMAPLGWRRGPPRAESEFWSAERALPADIEEILFALACK